MFAGTKISLSVPDKSRNDRKFSFRLKQDLNLEPCEYVKPRKIFVMSDIEGNFNAFCKLLLKGGVINKYLQWTFDDGHLVIVGDCFDRGDSVIECLWLVYSLEEKARREGGYVHFILGNHEVMNINGDWRYIHPKYASIESVPRDQLTALYGGNTELWRWLLTKNIIERVGDILFVHGGIAPELLKLNLTIEQINALARSYLKTNTKPEDNSSFFALFDSQDAPFWFRGYYDRSISESVIDNTLLYFNVNTIVTGHTVVEHVSTFYGGKVINTDTEHSVGNSEALLIRKEKFYRVNTNGTREKLK